MRISLLEKRENFEKILRETLISSSFFNENYKVGEKKYYINKHLNFIATTKLPKKVFQILVNEYSSSLSWWKSGIQSSYVRVAISKFFRSILSHGSITLPDNFESFLILGGNHRLRLFSVELNSSIVLLKQGERINYLKNDIAIRTENTLTYAPELLKYGGEWLEEEYFEGTPINRLEDQSVAKDYLNEIFENHFKTLNLNGYENILKQDYIDLVKNEIVSISTNKLIRVKLGLIGVIDKVFTLLFAKLLNNDVRISWTHGDFQQANILIAKGSYKVIDWEASEKRFFMYDAFTLLGGIRQGELLTNAISNFKDRVKSIDYIDEVNENMIILLLIEELRFNINETFSVNFYESGSQTESLCNAIITYINE